MFEVSVTIPAVYEDVPFDEGVERAAAAGVDAIELFDWDHDRLDDIAAVAADHGVDVAGVLLQNGMPDTDPAMTHPNQVDDAIADLRETIRAAEELDAASIVTTVGAAQDDHSLHVQHRCVVDTLRAVADEAERAGVTVSIEPLNIRVDHPEYYLTSVREARDIVEAVDSPGVQILFDCYHTQVSDGDIIATLQECSDHIGHYHVADVPGRHEPGTGELNYRRIAAVIAKTGFDGYVGCEFWPIGDPDEELGRVVDMLSGV